MATKTRSTRTRKQGKNARVPKSIPEASTALCQCGCGETPTGKRSRFLPGHDAKLKSMAIKVRDGDMKISDVPKEGRSYVKDLLA